MNTDWNITWGLYEYSYMILQDLHRSIYSLEVLYENIESYIEKYLEKDLEKKVNEEVDGTDEDQRAIIQAIFGSSSVTIDARDIFSQYMIVATYSFYEKYTKSIFYLLRKLKYKKLSKKKIDDCFKDGKFAEFLFTEFNIVYKDLTDYKRVELLRLLNNDIKHTGKITSKKLKIFNDKWRKNTLIQGNIYNCFKYIKDAPFNLLEDITNQLVKAKSK
ncbi:MAG: hypothetical protein J0M37_12335 [Ignavibacteria bacterium]|nr:hypothetical protein [Ignavibacteria bacterium]